MLYTNASLCNLEKWFRGTYFQGKNRDPDVENRPEDRSVFTCGTGREGEGGMNWESRIDKNSLPCVK